MQVQRGQRICSNVAVNPEAGLNAAHVPPNLEDLPSHRSLCWGHCGKEQKGYLEAEAPSGVKVSSVPSPGPCGVAGQGPNPHRRRESESPVWAQLQRAGVWTTLRKHFAQRSAGCRGFVSVEAQVGWPACRADLLRPAAAGPRPPSPRPARAAHPRRTARCTPPSRCASRGTGSPAASPARFGFRPCGSPGWCTRSGFRSSGHGIATPGWMAEDEAISEISP